MYIRTQRALAVGVSASAISTIVSMCRENEIDIDDLLNNKAS